MFINQTVNGSNIIKLQSDLFNTNTRVLIPSIYTRLSQTHLSIPSKTKNNQSDMESPKGVWIKLNINGDQKETKDMSLQRQRWLKHYWSHLSSYAKTKYVFLLCLKFSLLASLFQSVLWSIKQIWLAHIYVIAIDACHVSHYCSFLASCGWQYTNQRRFSWSWMINWVSARVSKPFFKASSM